jgi:hypothetical protein
MIATTKVQAIHGKHFYNGQKDAHPIQENSLQNSLRPYDHIVRF